VVERRGDTFEIDGGEQVGGNLFHSFEEFSVPTDTTAAFDNAATVENTISRVTGESLSAIDGTISANGNANVILINPNGIQFGPNAQLQIGGSFLGSTATSLDFADGTRFSAVDANAAPLLTVSAPMGLQFGPSAAPIRVEGIGHDLTVSDPIFDPVTLGQNGGLQVQPGRTLALVGGDIDLTGGVLTAPSGRLVLSSVESGRASFQEVTAGWQFDFSEITGFRDLQLGTRSLVDASGSSGGSAAIWGRNVALQDGSLVLVQNRGPQPAGTIAVNASDSVEVSGTNGGTIRSSLTNETVGLGSGGDVIVNAPQVSVEDGATIVAKTFSLADGGDLTINAPESLQVSGTGVLPSATSSVVTATFGPGDSGNSTISAGRLVAKDGGTVASSTFRSGGGSGGTLDITATDSIDVVGIVPGQLTPSGLTVATLGSGRAGNLTIGTPRLSVREGGRVDASTVAAGDGGNVTIVAPESVTVTGGGEALNPSLLSSSANKVDETIQQLFELPPTPSGSAGDLSIQTGTLQVSDGGQVTARSEGMGDAGMLEVNADAVSVENGGGISASANGGTGGDLTIETGKLAIANRGFVSTTTFGGGEGGDLTVRATESVDLVGTGFADYQQTFQVQALRGTLRLDPNTRFPRTGLFAGSAGAGASGDLTIETPSLQLLDGAVVFGPTFGSGDGGNIFIRNADEVEIAASAIQTGTAQGSTGDSGNVEIDTNRAIVRDGASVINATFGSGKGGNVTVNAGESVEILDTPEGALVLTGILTNTSFGNGQGGDVRVSADRIFIRDGVIGSNTGALLSNRVITSGGPGGSLKVEASDSIEVVGAPSTRLTSGIGTTTYSTAPAGDLTIDTGRLVVRDGADISAATLGTGQGGTLTVRATESVELSGRQADGVTLGGLFATSGRKNLSNLSKLPATGPSGSVVVETPELIVRDGASIDVQSLRTGETGSLNIVADSVVLDDGNLSASTPTGTGGNIDLQVNSLAMLDGSKITAEAGGDGDGGNIEISGWSAADFVLLAQGSLITANAEQGDGGNVTIDAGGLFQCPDCAITASSKLGIDGEVEIATLEAETSREPADLPEQVAVPEEIVEPACEADRGQATSEFVVTGRGGLPPSPTAPLSSEAVVPFESSGPTEPSSQAAPPSKTATDRSELAPPAQGWYVDGAGTVILAARPVGGLPNNPSLPTADCHKP
jgi:filamentous hemagglutinin family protein